MTDQDQSGPEAAVPGPDTFSFEDYVSGASTFPRFHHTVFLNQKAGAELNSVYDECKKVQVRGREIESELKARSENSSRSFIDDESESLSDEMEELRGRSEILNERKAALEEEVRKNRLTLHFQVGTAQKLGTVSSLAEKEYRKKHGRGSEEDMEYMAGKNRHLLVAQMEAYCTHIILADGTKEDPPSKKGLFLLVDSLIASEMFRLQNTMIEELHSSASWADRLDAGFHGRGADVADEPVGSSGDQDGQVVGSSATDVVDRGGI